MLPIVITNDDPYSIKDQIFSILNHPDIDTILFFSPYVSSYFIDIVQSSSISQILALTNSNPPSYTKEAMNKLWMMDAENIKRYINSHHDTKITENMKKNLKLNRRVYIRKIHRRSFVHMKLLITYFIDKTSMKLYPRYVFSGSVNWTKNGIVNNDEILIILRDRSSIMKCVSIIEKLWEEGIDYFQRNH